MSAKAAERERRATSEIRRNVEAARDAEVCAKARLLDRADRERLTGAHRNRHPERNVGAVEGHLHRRTGERDGRRTPKPERRAGHRHLESGRAFGIAEHPIAESKRERVHRPRRRNADGPVSNPARVILNRRLGAGREHVDAAGRIVERAEERRRDGARLEHVGTRDRAEVVEVRLDARDPRRVERLRQRCDRGVPRVAPHDDLREQGVVERRHFDAALDPRLGPDVFRKAHVGE